MAIEHVDVLIVGAGLSGIGAACHLQEDCPGKTYAILESRGAIGGTWDLFRYPGIRSDSDMFTLGYAFRPWTDSKSIADGEAIRHYIQDTAREYGVEEKIRFHHRVVSADWSSEDARWTVTAQRTDTGETVQLTCSWLSVCSGYYRYDEGFRPSFEGEDRFPGEVIHPQHWPEDFDAVLPGGVLDVVADRLTVGDRLRVLPRPEGVAEGEHVRVRPDAGVAEQVPGSADGAPGLQDRVGLPRAVLLQMAGGPDAGQAGADDQDVHVLWLHAGQEVSR